MISKLSRDAMPYVTRQRPDGVPVKMWTRGVPVEPEAMTQLENVAAMPFVGPHVAAMPDVHWGIGATVGSVIPTLKAVIPAAVGVDLGCGMMAVRLDGVTAEDLPDSLGPVRAKIEKTIPVGRERYPDNHLPKMPKGMPKFLRFLSERHPEALRRRKLAPELLARSQYGTLGGGNHFIEVCLDEADDVWVMLHSGSRGLGNAVGTYFIGLARKDMERLQRNLPDRDLAYFEEGTEHYDDYRFAVFAAQEYAEGNRREMMRRILIALRPFFPPFRTETEAVNCHHNYVTPEIHYGQEYLVTRKGAVRAGRGELGIIPGSMGARSYIVRGLGNPESFESCAHGAGRAMSRRAARRRFTVADHEVATAGVECRKDEGVLDETPGAYKDIDQVMEAQRGLVETVHELRQVVCVKG